MTLTDNKWITWKSKTIKHGRSCACGVYKDRYVLIAGGYPSHDFADSDEIHDTITQSQTTIPMFPEKGQCEGVVLNDHFYVRVKRDSIYRLSLSTPSKWEKLEHRESDEISKLGIVSDGKSLYLLSEVDSTPACSSLKINGYDPMTNKFTCISVFPCFDRFGATVTVRNLIFFIGKRNTFSSKLDVFDISTKSLLAAPDLPIPMRYIKATSFRRWIIIVGGSHIGPSYIGCFILDTQTQQWAEFQSKRFFYSNRLATTRSHIVSIANGRKLRAIHIKYIIPHWRWKMIKDFVLLRKLIDDNRAHPFSSKGVKNDSENDAIKINETVKKLFTDLSLDIFRTVMTFLM